MPSSALCWQKMELVEAMPSLSQCNALIWQLWWTPATPNPGRGTGGVCQDQALYKPKEALQQEEVMIFYRAQILLLAPLILVPL